MLASIFKIKNLFILIVVSAIGFGACQSNRTGQGKNNQKIQSGATLDTLSYEMEELSAVSPYLTENEGQIDTTIIEIVYPVFVDSNVNRLVMNNILFDGEKDLQQYLNNFIEGYGNFIEENDVNYPMAWHKETNVHVPLISPELMVIKNFTYEFSGGAHGNSYENTNVYDLKNLRKLALNTFISENKMKEFTNIAEKIFREQEGISDTASLAKDYFFENGKFALAANYAIDKNSFILHYNVYEIKPYAAGSTTLYIPYDQVKDLMTETGKIYIQNLKDYFQTIQ